MQGTTVTSKGQVTIPKAVRQRLGIRQGSKVAFEVKGERVELRVLTSALRAPAKGAYGLRRSRRKAVPADFDPASVLRRVGK